VSISEKKGENWQQGESSDLKIKEKGLETGQMPKKQVPEGIPKEG